MEASRQLGAAGQNETRERRVGLVKLVDSPFQQADVRFGQPLHLALMRPPRFGREICPQIQAATLQIEQCVVQCVGVVCDGCCCEADVGIEGIGISIGPDSWVILGHPTSAKEPCCAIITGARVQTHMHRITGPSGIPGRWLRPQVLL